MSSEAIASPIQGHIHRLDPRHDLEQVANLVELCFSDTLDPDGRQYLQGLREAAQNARLMGWASALSENAPTPLSGYVWEENGQIIGNLSLIPIRAEGQRAYLIANVAVHPEQRGRGIARLLTQTAVEYARSRRVPAVWLQVRDDNPSAIHIYRTTGFYERARRTTWHSSAPPPEQAPPDGLSITPRRQAHWAQQRTWLQALYPPALDWHLNLDWRVMRPDLLGLLYRAFLFESVQHWAAVSQARLAGVLTWYRASGSTDPLWLAAPNPPDEAALFHLLAHARRRIPKGRPLSLNLPHDFAPETVRAAGFHPRQTLIWMERRF